MFNLGGLMAIKECVEYHIWAYIEKHWPDDDSHKDMGEPEKVATLPTLEAAQDYVVGMGQCEPLVNPLLERVQDNDEMCPFCESSDVTTLGVVKEYDPVSEVRASYCESCHRQWETRTAITSCRENRVDMVRIMAET